jgi:hypothetical protein
VAEVTNKAAANSAVTTGTGKAIAAGADDASKAVDDIVRKAASRPKFDPVQMVKNNPGFVPQNNAEQALFERLFDVTLTAGERFNPQALAARVNELNLADEIARGFGFANHNAARQAILNKAAAEGIDTGTDLFMKDIPLAQTLVGPGKLDPADVDLMVKYYRSKSDALKASEQAVRAIAQGQSTGDDIARAAAQGLSTSDDIAGGSMSASRVIRQGLSTVDDIAKPPSKKIEGISLSDSFFGGSK